MPIYDFICKKCSHTFESIAKYDEKVPCEKCQSETEHGIGSVSIYNIKGDNGASTQGRLHKKYDDQG